jgi:hypothetical protein
MNMFYYYYHYNYTGALGVLCELEAFHASTNLALDVIEQTAQETLEVVLVAQFTKARALLVLLL